jgi:DNA-binding MarR family transcriptional regulator
MSKIDLDELYYALHRLNRQMHRTAHREGHRKGGLYHGQANLLFLILQSDGASQRDLAEQLDVRPSSMTEMLAKLEQNDLIERKQDDKDQRVMRIYLTEKGEKMAKEIAESKDTFAESFFQALSEDEQEQLMILIKKLCSSLEAAEDSHSERIHHEHGAYHHGSCGDNGMHHGYGHHAHHRYERRTSK